MSCPEDSFNRADYEAHDQTCKSLELWKAFVPGGVSSLGDFGSCLAPDCEGVFWWGAFKYLDEDLLYDFPLCECCSRTVKWEQLTGSP